MHEAGYFVSEVADISTLTGREMGSQGDRGWIQVTERRKDMGCYRRRRKSEESIGVRT